MSKKIIYLLSLLMALSLVFASCKKNSVTDALGGGNQPPSTGGNDQGSGDNGLYTDSESMPNDDEFIRRTKLFNGEVGGNYHRNPVIVAGRGGAVFIFLEKRWERAGAANDVGVDGEGKVDIVYLTSKNSGKDNFNNSLPTTVGKAAETATESHGAPVVFYKQGSSVEQDTIVIVASAGDGIGRTSKDSSEKNSKIEYIVGGFSDNYTINWGKWTILDVDNGQDGNNLKTAIQAISTGVNNKKFSQFGTHAERGLISGEKLILPVIMAYQGNNTTKANIYELMGAYIVEGTLSGNGSSASVAWKAATNPQKTGYNGTATATYGNRLGQWKESHIAPTDVNGSAYDVLVIPSPQERSGNNTLGIANGNSVAAVPQALPASEGSFGYLLTGKWFGDKAYTADGTGKLTPKDGGLAEERIIYTHVQSQVTKLTLHILNKDRTKVGSYQLGATGKSSSVDMLPDGSVVIAAENTQDGKGYFLYFERYSQAQLARLAK